jgi:hypothetical protein
MKNLRIIFAIITVVAASLLAPNQLKADGGCVVCTMKDGRCEGASILACVDDKYWWQSWNCKTEATSIADCPVDPL